VVNSWVGSGQNQPVSPGQLGSALGPGVIKTLSQMTGVSEDSPNNCRRFCPGSLTGWLQTAGSRRLRSYLKWWNSS